MILTLLIGNIPVAAKTTKPSKPSITTEVTNITSEKATIIVKIDKTKNADGYEIYEKVANAEDYKKIKTLKKSGKKQREYAFECKLSDKKVYIKVRAYNGSKYGKYSAVSKIKLSNYTNNSAKPTENTDPTKASGKIPVLPADKPIDVPQNLPLTTFDRNNLPDSFETEEELSDWLADRSCRLNILPSMELHGFTQIGSKKIVKTVSSVDWTYYHYEFRFKKKNIEIRIVVMIGGDDYVDALDGRELFAVRYLEFLDEGEVFYDFDGKKYNWPKEGLEYFLQNF